MNIELAVARAASRRGDALATVASQRWSLAIWMGMLGWSVVLFAVVRSDYVGFGLPTPFDLGNMVQAVWSTAHGHPLRTTGANGVEVSRLAYHVDPILVLLAPLWTVWSSPLMLAAVQIVACALGAAPVFWLARRHLGSELAAALMTLAYLAYPWLAWTALDVMHPVTLAIPLFLYAIWFLDGEKLVPFACFAVLAAATGELMGLSIAALGIWYAISRQHRLAGLVIALLGAGWTVLAVKVIVPAFLGHQSVYYAQYEGVGGSPLGVVRSLVTDPGVLVSKLLSGDNLVFWVWLALPLLGLFAFAPWLAVVAVPAVLVNGLSDRAGQSDPRSHYVAGVIPFLVAAAVLGLARFAPRGRLRGAGVICGVSAGLLVVIGPIPGTPLRDRTVMVKHPDRAHIEALESAIALVPADTPVTVSKFLRPRFAARRHMYVFPVIDRSSWLVLDTRPALPYWQEAGQIPARLERDRSWAKVFSEDGVLVYKRTASA
jgi:uncharacterized membrane protein